MKLSLVFELLLIFVLLAFAASKSIKKNKKKALADKSAEDKQEDNGINKYCRCSEAYCNCCREFQVPYVNLDGPGCASLMYLEGDKLSVSLSFGKKVITNRTISSKKAAPVCMPMPGGVSKFCGRIYNIARVGEDFRACLGLELQSKSTVEAAVRVSCFKFGPKGVNLEHADPLPLVTDQKAEEEDDDDDDDDDDDEDFDLAGVDDDDDDLDVGDDDDDDGETDATNDVESADYTGFSLLDEDILGDLFGTSGGKKPNKNKNKVKNNKQKQAPTSTTTTNRPRPTRRPTTRRPPTVRTTTQRATTTRTTTVRVRPANRRPTRRPGNRRPGNRRTTTTTSTVEPIIASSSTEQTTPSTPLIRSTEKYVYTNAESDQTFEPVVIVTQRPSSMMPTKSVTDFEDSGIEMSLAQLTGQLSGMPVTPILSNNNKDEGKMTTALDMNYEKVATVTAKAPTTVSLDMSSEQAVQDDLVQIVQSLESNSDEHKETLVPEETRAFHFVNRDVVGPTDFYSGIVLPKRKPKGEEFEMEDLDVLDLTQIGESVGQQLGIFGKGKNKNKNRNKNKNKNKDENQNQNQNQETDCEDGSSDYTDIGNIGSIDTGFDFADRKNKGRSSRRQNKMMRGDWS